MFSLGDALSSSGARHATRRDARDEAPSALLPCIGGMGSRMGRTELHYIGEFIGVILI